MDEERQTGRRQKCHVQHAHGLPTFEIHMAVLARRSTSLTSNLRSNCYNFIVCSLFLWGGNIYRGPMRFFCARLHVHCIDDILEVNAASATPFYSQVLCIKWYIRVIIEELTPRTIYNGNIREPSGELTTWDRKHWYINKINQCGI